jgi:hypothetical protein
MIFGKNLKNIKNTKVSYRNTYLKNVSEFKFLGNVITQNGNLVSCAEALSQISHVFYKKLYEQSK